MKERHIIFSAPMVRAIRSGQKTQTRRVIKPPRGYAWLDIDAGTMINSGGHKKHISNLACPYGQPGDRLWVKETYMDLAGTGVERVTGDKSRYAYRADTPPGSYGDECRKELGLLWRPSIFMPKVASRIFLEVTAVRAERLQDIREEDAIAEGTPGGHGSIPGYPYAATPGEHYRHIRESINGPRSRDANPWVRVVAFKVINHA